jgi:hypothetical protein
MKIPKNMVQLIAELKTPKQRKNSFAKFQYRNVEDITQGSTSYCLTSVMTFTKLMAAYL